MTSLKVEVNYKSFVYNFEKRSIKFNFRKNQKRSKIIRVTRPFQWIMPKFYMYHVRVLRRKGV